MRAVVHELGTAGSTVELIEKTLEALHRLVPADTVIFDEVSLVDGRTRGTTYPAGKVVEWADVMPVFEQWHFQSPNIQYFRQNPGGTARRWSDGDLDGFRRTELYREFMAPLGIHYQLSFCVPAQVDSQRAFILNRGASDFTDAEVVICNEISPYLGLLFNSASHRTRALIEHVDITDDATALVVDQTGAILSTTDAERCGLLADGSLDPHLRAWVRQGLSPRDLRLVTEPISDSITLEDGSAVAVRLLPDPAGSHVLLVEAVADPMAAQPMVDQALRAGLTRRQAEVMAELAAGGTNSQIACRLGISTETVKKHLTAAYRVLDVADRASAVAAIGAWANDPPASPGRTASS